MLFSQPVTLRMRLTTLTAKLCQGLQLWFKTCPTVENRVTGNSSGYATAELGKPWESSTLGHLFQFGYLRLSGFLATCFFSLPC